MSFTPWHQNLYLWKKTPFEIEDLIVDFRLKYNQIQTANLVLETLEKNKDRESEVGRRIKGTALFYRANAYYDLSNLFLEGPNLYGYEKGYKIPVRTSTAITLKPELADLEGIKAIIKADLEMAEEMLPLETDYVIQPSKAAAKALKARVYLSWGEYASALGAAEEALALSSDLMDYNEVNPELNYSFREFNKEVIWHGRFNGSFNSSQSAYQIDPDLLALYDEGDLRRDLLYITRPTGYVNFKGSYTGDNNLFSGLAVDEMYLILSECLIRNGNMERAEKVLNELLSMRHSKIFHPVKFQDETQAIGLVLLERRKELPFRGLRWTDLRRNNADDRFKETLKRTYAGQEYFLDPESEQYVLPVPPREFSFY